MAHLDFRGSPRGYHIPNPGMSTPVRGAATPRGRGRGRGDGGYDPPGYQGRAHHRQKMRLTNAPLSHLLYEDRPLLKPIIFVRSQATPTLFMEEEEIFEPVMESASKPHVHGFSNNRLTIC